MESTSIGRSISPLSIRREKVGQGVCSVDLGWAQETLTDADGRIRVAGIRIRRVDGLETFEEICLAASFYQSTRYYEDIQALRDSKTLELFEKLKGFSESEIPLSVRDILVEAKKSATARKAVNKTPPVHHLRGAVWILRKAEVKGPVTDVLEAWYERWNHLNEWLVNGRESLLQFKKDFYRRTAHRLAGQASTLLLDADNFAKMAKIPAAEEGKKTMTGDVRQIAAPSMLRNALEQAFSRTLYVTALWSSRTCAECGQVNELEAGRTFACRCGHTDDRESNATANIIKAFLANPARFSAKRRVAEKLVEKKKEDLMEAIA